MNHVRIATTAVLTAWALVACQRSTGTHEAITTGTVAGASPTQADAQADISLIEGKWEGHGKRDGAKRTLEVGTDEAGNPVFRYCYQAHCRRSTGHTLTHQVVTPTKIEFRWNAGALFRFELEGDTLKGTRGHPRPINIFPMWRTDSGS